MRKPSEALKDWAMIVSIALVPVVLAFGQWHAAHRDTDRQYVQLAIDILRNPAKNKDGDRLRDWAVELVNETAPAKLTRQAKEELVKNGWQPIGWEADPTRPTVFSPKAFSPNAFNPNVFSMGLRRSTEEECEQRYKSDQANLEQCLAVARGTKK